ncbi:C45 family peptidase [Ornithinibacillus xuwenensis]|uniref:C45 family peptidase n=1 Tax=Ornithinibacillus xuwenensis TaxID=3144668 RepID=A0ABU9XFP6_9BACI
MYQDLKVDIIEACGSHYQIGYEQGKQLSLDRRFEGLQSMSNSVNIEQATAQLLKYSPGLLEEIRGLSDGLDINLETAIRIFSGFNVKFPTMGCTAYADGNVYIRNYDFSPELYDARFVFQNPDNGYASVGFSQQILGRLDGMNEHGLVVGLHLVNEDSDGLGFLATTIVRIILEQCKDVDEAINIMTHIPQGYCYNYSLLDKHGNSCVIEAAPQKREIRRDSILQCTNHFETNSMLNQNRTFISASLQRKKTLQKASLESLTPKEMYAKFNAENSPLFFKDYHHYFGTMHTVVYLPETLEIIVGIGGDFTPVVYSLKDWVTGYSKLQPFLIGKIDVKQ